MKINSYKYIMCAAFALFTACSDEEGNDMQQPDPANPEAPSFTVGEADNEIVLKAGIIEGGKGVQTRAGEVIYKAFSGATQLRLRVDGTWLEHTPSKEISQTTTATTAASATIDSDSDTSGDNGSSVNDTHILDYVAASGDKKLYWDDYGTADPANMSLKVDGSEQHTGNGRDKGLTIYGVAVDGKATLPAPASGDNRTDLRLSNTSLDWENIQWNVGVPTSETIDQTSGWGNYDLLASNNVKEGSTDGTYKFNDRASGKLLKFTHAMTKITVNLTAGEGFPDYSSSDATAAKFASNPSVTLKGFNYIGKVDVINKTSSATKYNYSDVGSGETAATANVAMHLASGGANNNTASLEALVFPGNSFSDATNILKIEADGNIYYVNATNINAVNTETYKKFEQGKNYIFNVLVKKTEIKVTATVTDWEDVSAAQVDPVINISVDLGTPGTGTNNITDGFSFYRSLALNQDYSKDLSTNANDYFAAEAIAKNPTSGSQWVFNNGTSDIQLYWPNHNTHYQFRGVWPQTVTTAGEGVTSPRVRALSGSDATQVIDINNVAYIANSYPSDLMIARPEFAGADTDPLCANTETSHTKKHLYSDGICATEGLVTLNFRHVMAKVEVTLESTDPGQSDYVNIDANTVVEIVNVANDGYVKLGDRVVVASTQNQTYTLGAVSGDRNELIRRSAIVPQLFIQGTAGAATNTRFKITVTNADATKDVYYADIQPITYKDSSDAAYNTENQWKSGVYYKYKLKLTKTEVKLTATITDWLPVTGGTTIVM